MLEFQMNQKDTDTLARCQQLKDFVEKNNPSVPKLNPDSIRNAVATLGQDRVDVLKSVPNWSWA